MQIQTCFQSQCLDEIYSWVKGWSLRGGRAESSSARALSICWHSILGAIPTQAPVCCGKIVGLGSGWQNILRHEKMHKQKPCKKRVRPSRSTKTVIAAWGVKGENCAKWYKMLRKKEENWKVTAWQHPGWISRSLWDNPSLIGDGLKCLGLLWVIASKMSTWTVHIELTKSLGAWRKIDLVFLPSHHAIRPWDKAQTQELWAAELRVLSSLNLSDQPWCSHPRVSTLPCNKLLRC